MMLFGIGLLAAAGGARTRHATTNRPLRRGAPPAGASRPVHIGTRANGGTRKTIPGPPRRRHHHQAGTAGAPGRQRKSLRRRPLASVSGLTLGANRRATVPSQQGSGLEVDQAIGWLAGAHGAAAVACSRLAPPRLIELQHLAGAGRTAASIASRLTGCRRPSHLRGRNGRHPAHHRGRVAGRRRDVEQPGSPSAVTGLMIATIVLAVAIRLVPASAASSSVAATLQDRCRRRAGDPVRRLSDPVFLVDRRGTVYTPAPHARVLGHVPVPCPAGRGAPLQG